MSRVQCPPRRDMEGDTNSVVSILLCRQRRCVDQRLDTGLSEKVRYCASDPNVCRCEHGFGATRAGWQVLGLHFGSRPVSGASPFYLALKAPPPSCPPYPPLSFPPLFSHPPP